MDLDHFIHYLNEKILQFKENQIDEQEVMGVQTEIRNYINANPATGKELGKYFSIIGRALKSTGEDLDLVLYPISGGHLSIGHKPGGKIPFQGLKSTGITTILTLLNENEGAKSIQSGAEKEGIKWIWFPFSASTPPQGEASQRVWELYARLKSELEESNCIYIHCSAGIHRTGMVTYGLLRFLGHDQATSRLILSKLRKVTFEQVGEDRLAWGDAFSTI